jgi:hypothetical protein
MLLGRWTVQKASPKTQNARGVYEMLFVNILRVHPHLVIAGAEIELGEEFCTMKLIQ